MNTSLLTQQCSLSGSLSRRQPGCASRPKAGCYGTQSQQRQFCHKRASRVSVADSGCKLSILYAYCSTCSHLHGAENDWNLELKFFVQRVTTMGLFGLGLPEVAVVAGIAVLVFGTYTAWYSIAASSICSICGVQLSAFHLDRAVKAARAWQRAWENRQKLPDSSKSN